MNIFDFNHIDTSIDKTILEEIKAFYKHYHRKWWCYKQTYKHLKKVNFGMKVGSLSLIAMGIVAGGITLNPIILGMISGAGTILTGISQHKNYDKKIEKIKDIFSFYDSVLNELRSNLRGEPFDSNRFIFKMKELENVVCDPTLSPFSYYEKKYEKYIKKQKVNNNNEDTT